jgi:hypothetical protein
MADQEKLTAVKCQYCQKVIFPIRMFCPNCKSKFLVPIDIPSIGKIFSFTFIHYPLSAYNNPPYKVGLIEIQEQNIRLIAKIEADNDADIEIDQKVNLRVETFPESGNHPIVVARLIKK